MNVPLEPIKEVIGSRLGYSETEHNDTAMKHSASRITNQNLESYESILTTHNGTPARKISQEIEPVEDKMLMPITNVVDIQDFYRRRKQHTREDENILIIEKVTNSHDFGRQIDFGVRENLPSKANGNESEYEVIERKIEYSDRSESEDGEKVMAD